MRPDPHTLEDVDSRILQYARPSAADATTPRSIVVRRIVVAMAVIWPLVAGLAGSASDHVRIPLLKKIALSASAGIISTLLFMTVHRDSNRAANAFLWVALALLFVMWYWN